MIEAILPDPENRVLSIYQDGIQCICTPKRCGGATDQETKQIWNKTSRFMIQFQFVAANEKENDSAGCHN
ncbi:MAG TPA: hypothetical protein VFG11_04280 [Acidobacteriota bacterium]|nr:hypothetical protein [Acidobacteriota bacterium]